MVINLNIHVHVTNLPCNPAVVSGREIFEIWPWNLRRTRPWNVREKRVKHVWFFHCVYKHCCAHVFHANSTQFPRTFSRKFPAVCHACFPASIPAICTAHLCTWLSANSEAGNTLKEKQPGRQNTTHTHGFTDTGTRTDHLETPCATNSYYTTNCCTDPYYYITTPYSTKDKKFMKPPSIMWNQHWSSKLLILWSPEIVSYQQKM